MPDHLVTADQFRDLFLTDTPFLDVRAEVEFAKGRFPTSVNLPILNDEERHLVGACYKEKGKQAAIELGNELVSGRTRQARIDAWCAFAASHPGAHLYCWRGGMRSNYARQWMRDSGVEIRLIEGGFKALRRTLITEIEDAAAQVPMIRIGGKTGTAKTVLVNEVAFSTDLEGHANHRGSSFGRRVSGVPSQVDFENTLGIDLIKKRHAYPNHKLVIEDESRRIGACAVPQSFFQVMRGSPLAIIEMPMVFRVERIMQEYVIEMRQEFDEANPVDGWVLFKSYLTESLLRVQKRLGLERYGEISSCMALALEAQERSGQTDLHREWIRRLLEDYYDPMCDYQLGKQTDQIVFRGSYEDVLAWAQEQSAAG